MTGPTDPAALAVELHAVLPESARVGLSLQLRQSCHDLNNPLGTLGLELFSLDEVLQAAVEALGPAAVGPAEADLAELRVIVTNLTQAQGQLERTVATLQRFARSLG